MTVQPASGRSERFSAENVTFAIPNYNGRRFLELVLPSIARQSVTGFRVTVLDDASTDDSVRYLSQQWPDVKVLVAATNAGITKTIGKAFETAETACVALLNNDLEIDPHWLERLLQALAQHPDAAAVEGKTLQFDQRTVLDGAGDSMSKRGYPQRRGQGLPDSSLFNEPREIFSASGTAALYRRSVFDDVGFHDGDLIAYYEDVDWGFRARLRGWSAWYEPTAIAYHLGSATTGREANRYTHLIVRNQVVVLLKNLPGALLLKWLPRIIWFQLTWLPHNVLDGTGRAHLRGLLAALRVLPRTLVKRREIQRRRTIVSGDLERVID